MSPMSFIAKRNAAVSQARQRRSRHDLKPCAACVYFLPTVPAETEGICRRFPPVVIVTRPGSVAEMPSANAAQIDASLASQYPGVKATFTCGEHEPAA